MVLNQPFQPLEKVDPNFAILLQLHKKSIYM
jgi:hypothetical protein